MDSKIHFIGDVHGSWQSLNKQISKIKADYIIQVGDFGFFPGSYPASDFPSKEVRFIDGNHDNIDYLREWDKNKIYYHSNLIYCPRGSYENLTLSNGRSVGIGYLGGAESIDKDQRIEGVSWWRDEHPSTKELNDFFDMLVDKKPEIIVTHEAPYGISKELLSNSYFNGTSIQLQKLFDSLPYYPKFWFHGHYHKLKITKMKQTVFGSLAACHRLHAELPSPGVYLKFKENGNIDLKKITEPNYEV